MASESDQGNPLMNPEKGGELPVSALWGSFCDKNVEPLR